MVERRERLSRGEGVKEDDVVQVEEGKVVRWKKLMRPVRF